jgi:hypothetical protein
MEASTQGGAADQILYWEIGGRECIALCSVCSDWKVLKTEHLAGHRRMHKLKGPQLKIKVSVSTCSLAAMNRVVCGGVRRDSSSPPSPPPPPPPHTHQITPRSHPTLKMQAGTLEQIPSELPPGRRRQILDEHHLKLSLR